MLKSELDTFLQMKKPINYALRATFVGEVSLKTSFKLLYFSDIKSFLKD